MLIAHVIFNIMQMIIVQLTNKKPKNQLLKSCINVQNFEIKF